MIINCVRNLQTILLLMTILHVCYDSPQTTANRYSVQNSQIITPIDTSIGFAPPVSCFPGTAQRAIVATENQQQLRQYILSLQKLLQNFAVYRSRCRLTIKV